MTHSDKKSVLQIIKYCELLFSCWYNITLSKLQFTARSIGNICFPYLANYTQLTWMIKNVNLRVCAACIAITHVGKINTHVGNIVLIGNLSFRKIRSPNCEDGLYINSMWISLRNSTLKTRTDMHLVHLVNIKTLCDYFYYIQGNIFISPTHHSKFRLM